MYFIQKNLFRELELGNLFHFNGEQNHFKFYMYKQPQIIITTTIN